MFTLLGFGLVLALAWPTRSRRTLLDSSYLANVLSIIDNSNLMELVARDCTGRLNSLLNIRSAIGVFMGTSGKQSLGIDVAARVTNICKKSWRI
jgi:hypothetical protein